MLMSTTPILVLLVSNLFIGTLIMWFVYRGTMSEGEKKIEKLRTSLKNKDVKLKDLKEEMLEHESNIEGLQETITKKDKNIRQISAQVKERDDSVSGLNRDLSDIRARARGWLRMAIGRASRLFRIASRRKEGQRT